MDGVSGQRVAWDTSAAIYYLESVTPYRAWLERQFEELRTQDGILLLSVVVYHELMVGPWKQRNASALARIVRFCRKPPVVVLALTPGTARLSARLRGETGLATPDSLVIATARSAGCVELVGNDARWRRFTLGLPYRFLDDVVGA